eukprot:COSAG01_NODE_2930_length_6835_cov_82.625891_4_plen_88_part_00
MQLVKLLTAINLHGSASCQLSVLETVLFACTDSLLTPTFRWSTSHDTKSSMSSYATTTLHCQQFSAMFKYMHAPAMSPRTMHRLARG